MDEDYFDLVDEALFIEELMEKEIPYSGLAHQIDLERLEDFPSFERISKSSTKFKPNYSNR